MEQPWGYPKIWLDCEKLTYSTQEQRVFNMLSVKNLKKVFQDATEASSIEFV